MGGQWFVLAAALLWGTTGTAQAFAPTGTQPAAVGAVRLIIGSMVLLTFAHFKGVLHRGTPWPLVPTAFASISIAAYQLFFFAGVSRTGVAIGTIIAIGSAPILAGLLAYLWRKEKPRQKWILATMVAVAGCVLIMIPKGDVQIDPLGFLLTLGAGAAYATYAVTSKGLLDSHPPDAVAAVVFSLGAIFLSPLLIRANLAWLVQPRGLAVALHLGVFATAAAYVLFSRGLMSIPVASAVTLSLAEPVTAGILGILLLGERLTPLILIGMALVLSGLALLSSPTLQHKPAKRLTD